MRRLMAALAVIGVLMVVATPALANHGSAEEPLGGCPAGFVMVEEGVNYPGTGEHGPYARPWFDIVNIYVWFDFNQDGFVCRTDIQDCPGRSCGVLRVTDNNAPVGL